MKKVRCEICGKALVKVYPHLATHSISAAEYKASYPNAELSAYRHSERTLSRMRGPRESQRGVSKSEAHRAALSASKTGRKLTPHTAETKKKISQAWVRRRQDAEKFEAYKQSVSEQMRSPDMLLIQRARSARIMKSGALAGIATGTSLEIAFAQFLAENAITFRQQEIIETPKGHFAFDLYIVDSNMLVEVDGEYWHRSAMQFNRDKLKQKLVEKMGYRFLRISDADWKPEMVHASLEDIAAHNEAILAARAAHLGIAA